MLPSNTPLHSSLSPKPPPLKLPPDLNDSSSDSSPSDEEMSSEASTSEEEGMESERGPPIPPSPHHKTILFRVPKSLPSPPSADTLAPFPPPLSDHVAQKSVEIEPTPPSSSSGTIYYFRMILYSLFSLISFLEDPVISQEMVVEINQWNKKKREYRQAMRKLLNSRREAFESVYFCEVFFFVYCVCGLGFFWIF